MKLSKITVETIILGAYLAYKKLDSDVLSLITNALYADRRGGELADLYADEMFIKALDWQLS